MVPSSVQERRLLRATAGMEGLQEEARRVLSVVGGIRPDVSLQGDTQEAANQLVNGRQPKGKVKIVLFFSLLIPLASVSLL